MASMSLSQTTKPKSDQVNAEDFLTGSKTLTVTGFCFSSSADQPFLIYTDFDDKKPYKPNKTMRKILNAAWGEVSGDINVIYNDWNGRKLTLYRDADVEWAGKKEGGIVIEAMSHLDRELRFHLQKKRGQKKEYTIKIIKGGISTQTATQAPAAQPEQPNAKREWAVKLKAAVNYGSLAVDEIWAIVPVELKADMEAFYKERYIMAQAFDPVDDEPIPEHVSEQLPPPSLDDF